MQRTCLCAPKIPLGRTVSRATAYRPARRHVFRGPVRQMLDLYYNARCNVSTILGCAGAQLKAPVESASGKSMRGNAIPGPWQWRPAGECPELELALQARRSITRIRIAVKSPPHPGP